MKHILDGWRWLGVIGFAALLVGCSTVRTSYDFDPTADFSRLRTYSYAVPPRATDRSVPEIDPILEQRVRLAIDTALQAKGYVRGEIGAVDFYVGFVPVIQRFIGVDYYGGWGWGGTAPYTYDQGTIIVDILSPPPQELLWRGSVTRAVDLSRDPQGRQKDLNAGVERLLRTFPPPTP